MNIITTTFKSVMLLCFTVCSMAVRGQVAESRDFIFGFGVSTGLPTADGFNYVVGGDVRVQRDIARSVAGLLSIGYTEFQQSNRAGIADFGFVPVKIGAKVFPFQRLYVTGEIGSAINQRNARESQFIWAPGIGFNLNNSLDVGLRYEEAKRRGITTGQCALRVAYNFNLSDLMARF